MSEPAARPMIELCAASKRFGRVVALAPVDLALARGRVTVLIGPSGCGKSTLLRLIVGLEQPSSGEVRVDGEPLSPARLSALRQRMGYVIQDGGLFPHLSVRGNVTLLQRHLGWPEPKIAARLSELCALAHFPEDHLDRFPLELSGGQRQRVSLMRALALDPDLLLLDEPLGALDPLIRAELQEDLKRIFAALKKTVVLVTHDLAEAGFLGDRLVLLRDGSIVQSGTLAELVRAPADPFVTRFIHAQRSPLEALPA